MKTGMLLTSVLFVSSFAMAQDVDVEGDGAALVQVSRCYSCHHVTEALLGPPYKAIAARHAANKGSMVDVLTQKIILGGGGNWGLVPMVPNEHVSKDDARIIAQWILDQSGE